MAGFPGRRETERRNMIEVKNLTKYYGDKLGVQDISFTIGDREIVGLLGPNGAGKSTLMKMLTGYHLPTAGEMYIDGIDAIENPRLAMSKIGFMPEIPPLYVDMTVSNFLAFCAKIRGVKKNDIEHSVADVMKTAALENVSGRLIRNLSKGYRQRVGLAQALIGEPEILIMDEPSVGLDPRQMAELRQLITDLGKDHTVIVSSHILAELNQVCSRYIIINKGHLIADEYADRLDEGIKRGDNFSLKLKTDFQTANRLLSEINGIRSVSDRSDAVLNNTMCLLDVEAEDESVREKLFYALAEAHIPAFELNSEKPTLEQVFLKLTDTDSAYLVSEVQ